MKKIFDYSFMMFLLLTYLVVIGLDRDLFITISYLVIILLCVTVFYFSNAMVSLKHSNQIDIWGFGIIVTGILFTVAYLFGHVNYFETFNNHFISPQFWILANASFITFFFIGIFNKKTDDESLLFLKVNVITIFFILALMSLTGFVPEFYIRFIKSENSNVYTGIVFGLIFLSSIPITWNRLKHINKKSHILLNTVLVIFGLQFIYAIIFINMPGALLLSRFSSYTLAFVTLAFLYIHHLIYLPLSFEQQKLEVDIKKLANVSTINREDSLMFKTLFEEAPLGYQSLDEKGCFITVNPTFCQVLGYRREEVIGKSFEMILGEEEKRLFRMRFPIFKEKGLTDVIFQLKHKNGEMIPFRFIGRISRTQDGNFKQTHCLLSNISGEVQYQRSITESKQKLDELIRQQSENSYIIDQDGMCLFINQETCKMLDYDESELLETKINDIIISKSEDDQKLGSLLDVTYKTGKEIYNQSAYLKTKKGNEIPIIFTSKRIIRENKIIGAIISFTRYDTGKQFVERLIRMSYYDSLTGAYNRQYYNEEIQMFDKIDKLPLSIVLVDINGLKLINDAFGHLAGDELIKDTVTIITSHLKIHELIARIGGDEFVIIMPKTNYQQAEKRMLEIQQTFNLKETNGVQLSIAYGIATKINIDESYTDVYTRAEDAMYRQKLTEIPSKRNQAIKTIIKTLEEKDPYSNIHSEKVSIVSARIAEYMELGQTVINDVRTAGLLHDIGKIVVSTTILTKSGKLTEEEYNEIKKHSEIGYRILNSSSNMREISTYVLHHHERIDGKGYPSGLLGKDIPVHSKIISVADAVDSMVNTRPYRKALTKEKIIFELKTHSGTQFDKNIVEVVLEHFNEIYELTKHNL